MFIGYMRPYHDDANCERQLQVLRDKHCHKIISEAHASPKRRNKLENLLMSLCRGDKVMVTKLYAIADSTRHLVELLDRIEAKGASLLSLQEGIDTSNVDGYSFIHIVKHLTAFQSDVISEQTKQGMTKVKEEGRATGRPRKPDANVRRAITMYDSKKYSLADIKNETGISKSTLYRYLEN